MREALERFVNGGPRGEIEEVVRGPDPDRFVTPDAIQDRSFEIEIRATSGRYRSSDICRHISDRIPDLCGPKNVYIFRTTSKIPRPASTRNAPSGDSPRQDDL